MKFITVCCKWSLLWRIGLAASIILVSYTPAEAQRYRRGFGPSISPIIPVPFYAPMPAPPIIAVPRSGVRVQTPFFSLNVGPGPYIGPSLPPRYLPGYLYESYRPRYDYGYGYAELYPPAVSPAPIYPPPTSRYRAPSGRQPPLGMQRIQPLETAPSPDFGQTFSLESLRQSALMLYNSLSERGEEGQIWIDFLKPDVIADAASIGQLSAEIVELTKRYEGVTMNADLRQIEKVAGFDSTYRLLGQWINTLPNAPASNLPASNLPAVIFQPVIFQPAASRRLHHHSIHRYGPSRMRLPKSAKRWKKRKLFRHR